MAIYEYLCEVNDEEFEATHSIKAPPLEECAVCKEKGLPNHKPKRLISLSGRGVVELSGNELVAKVKADTKKLRRDVYTNQNLLANVVGETKYEQNQRKK